MSKIDYGSDILKHYVRLNGWLPACKSQKKAVRRRNKKIPLKYFTFCAAEAIDVFMLERQSVLKRTEETGRLENVYFCEGDEEAFGRIADLIGSPTQGFLGAFEKIVLFEDDEETKGKDLFGNEEDAFSEALRRKLQVKEAHIRFQNAFPFDVMNLDVFGAMFPPRKGVLAPLLKAVLKILTWQTQEKFTNGQPCKQFTLFLTSHLDPDITDQEAIEQLKERLDDNIKTSADFKNAFHERFSHLQAGKLLNEEFAEFFCLAFPKFLTEHALTQLGWEVDHESMFLYNRQDKFDKDKSYQIMHSVTTFKRIANFNQTLSSSTPSKYYSAAKYTTKA